MDQTTQFSPSQTWPISDLRTMKLLVAPRRVQILTLLIEADRTVKEVASALRLPASRLYYHFNLLEHSGLITVVETRKVGGTFEKRYRASARSYRVDPGLLEEHDLAVGDQLAQVIQWLDECKHDMIRLAEPQKSDNGPREPEISANRSTLQLTDQQVRQLRQQVEAMHNPAGEQQEGQPEYTLLTAFYPSPG